MNFSAKVDTGSKWFKKVRLSEKILNVWKKNFKTNDKEMEILTFVLTTTLLVEEPISSFNKFSYFILS